MSVIDNIKHAPRWVWLATAGTTVGVIGIRFWRGRDAPEEEQTTDDGTTPGDALDGGSVQSATPGMASPGVIVPPIITSGDGQSSSDVAASMAGLLGGAFTDLTGQLGMVVSGTQGNIDSLISGWTSNNEAIIGAMAGAGAPPQPVFVNPAPVNVTVKAAPARPAASVPKVIATKAQPKDTWHDVKEYNSKTKRCQTIRVHSNGQRVVMSSKAGKC